MSQIMKCTHCSTPMKLGADAAGKQFRCPSCKQVFTAQAAPAPQPAGVGAAPAPTPTPSAAANAPASAPASGGTPSNCPACGSDLLEGAISCMDCGFLVQSDQGGSDEAAPNLCTNPACGVANPPGERNCQRCSTPLPTAPGTMIHNRYKIDRLLAMGGFGAVYLATDVKGNNQPVAIKDMICADPQEFSIRLNFFRREAQILKSLSNISIVPRVHDLIEQDQSAYLVLEFIRGQDLLKIMEDDNDKPFDPEIVIEWSKQVCDVLQHMHTLTPPLIHRDLKPDNIMRLEDQRSIKMIDFGTARDLGKTQKEKMAAKTRVYTEGYAPPEQIVGKPEPRSDLFALAGTIYHLIRGKAPEGFYTAKELEDELKDPNSPLPANYRWLYDLIRINLAEDINERYFSAKEMKADLERRQVTTKVACPSCKQTNTVREPYCEKCASPLTDPTPPCYHCGKTNRMGSRCCIHCGNRLR